MFPGSICAPIGSLQLRFSVVSDGGVTHSTAWTPTFTVTGTSIVSAHGLGSSAVPFDGFHTHTHTPHATYALHTHTGEFRIATIYPIFAEVNTDLFTAAAVDLVNKGVWEPSFSREPWPVE